MIKKDAKCESCELSFIWGKVRTAALGDITSDSTEELVLQTGSGGKSIYMMLVKEEKQ